MKATTLALILAVAALATACDRGTNSGAGFRMPEGDIEKGKAAFLELRCYNCHTVAGVNLPPPDGKPLIMVGLGGEVVKVKTYGQLVTSVIHPSHTFIPGYDEELIQHHGHSVMPDYTDAMTVRQMIDIVSFLEAQYQKLEPFYYHPAY
jgi:L-cysteine S-thiosulfotransferase